MLFKYAMLAGGAYLVLVGVSELLWTGTGSATLASIAAWPSVGSTIDPLVGSSNNANYVEGALDAIAGGALLYWAGFRL